MHGHDNKNVMLNLGFDVNIFMKKSWESMGSPTLVYFPIQLRMENQYHILPIGRLENVEVGLGGVNIAMEYEVTKIMGETDTLERI